MILLFLISYTFNTSQTPFSTYFQAEWLCMFISPIKCFVVDGNKHSTFRRGYLLFFVGVSHWLVSGGQTHLSGELIFQWGVESPMTLHLFLISEKNGMKGKTFLKTMFCKIVIIYISIKQKMCTVNSTCRPLIKDVRKTI